MSCSCLISEITILPEVLVDFIILPYAGNAVEIQIPDGLVQQVWVSTCENGNFFEIALKHQNFCFLNNPTLSFVVLGKKVFCKWEDAKRERFDKMNENCCGYVIQNAPGQSDKLRISIYAINELSSCDYESIRGFSLGMDAICYTENFIIYGFVYNFCAHCSENHPIYGPCFFCSGWGNTVMNEDDKDAWAELKIEDGEFEDLSDFMINTKITEEDIWEESVTPNSTIYVCFKCFLNQKLARGESREQIHCFLKKRPLYGQLNCGLECESGAWLWPQTQPQSQSSIRKRSTMLYSPGSWILKSTKIFSS